MKKKLIPILVALLLIIMVIGLCFAGTIIKKFIPSNEWADINIIFGVEGNETALILNNELLAEKGLFLENQVFIPIKVVNSYLNERYYWDPVEKLLVYALPDKLVKVNYDTLGVDGEKLIWVDDKDVYLSISFIEEYTDIRYELYQDPVNRIFINNDWSQEDVGKIKKTAKLRQEGDIKSDIVTELTSENKVTIHETRDNWLKVKTDTGFVGYIDKWKVNDIAAEVPVSNFVAPVYKNISLDENITLVWHQVFKMADNAKMEGLINKTKGVNVISPTWFSLTDNRGNFTTLADKDYVDKAHSMGMQVWALLDNLSNKVNSYELLTPTSNREYLIAGLMKQVEDFNLDGINLDFESYREEAAVPYLQFIRELSVACRNKGIVLSVDNTIPAAYNAFHNRKEQGIVVDYIIVMGYDEHYSGSEPGSSASLPFVEKGIKDTLEVVPKEKVINGVPFYARLWTEGADDSEKAKSQVLGMNGMSRWVEDNKVELRWMDELGQYYGQFVKDNVTQSLWIEDTKSMKLKMDVIRKYDIAGVACWKLGLESADVWDVINGKGN